MEKHAEIPGGSERRQHLHLRALYPEARTQIDHLFHNRHDWAGSPIDYLAQRAIHEAWPHLHADDVRILVNAIERVHLELVAKDTRH